MDQSKLKKLWLLAREGDEDAFAKIYDCYAEKIYRFIFLKVCSAVEAEQIAEEITQDVFVKLWKIGSDKQREVRNISALLFQIARFAVIDFYRSRGSERESLSLDDFENSLGTDNNLNINEAI